ncbi:MAG: Na+/H+ antiporter subunit G [Pseudomonadota bacterium]|nr:Na+/H+ antiporter subunit G [Pseudomonadota bacterium]
MNTAAATPVAFWVEAVVALLLVMSALFTLAAAWGLVRLKDFFQRMHPPALAFTWGAWCVTFASIFYFSAMSEGPQLHVWLIIILLSITVPVTSILLARAALFRGRQAGRKDLPAPLHPQPPRSDAETQTQPSP